MLNEKFVNVVIDEIEKMVDDPMAKVLYNKVNKNNGQTFTGITILMPGENISPNVYLERFITENERYTPNDIHNIAASINAEVKKAKKETPNIYVDKIFKPDFIKKHVSIRLVNYEANKEQLKDIPYIKFLDLAIICCVNVSKDGSYKVTNEILNRVGIAKENLFEIAKKNTPVLFPVTGINLNDLMFELMFGTETEHTGLAEINMDENPMYVLTNEIKVFGATSILYDGVLEQLAEQVNTDLIIVPSSVHEVIIVPCTENFKIDELASMIQEVNGNEVAPDEVLSDHPYLYNRITKQIEMV